MAVETEANVSSGHQHTGSGTRSVHETVGVLKTAVRRLTSRAALTRQNSAALLRRDTTSTLLRKTSATNIFAELDDVTLGPGVQLFYYSGWNEPNVHYKISDNQWTDLPGAKMQQLSTADKERANLPNFPPTALADEPIWTLHVPGVLELTFAPNNKGVNWDKAPGNMNYEIHQPGIFFLRNGKVQQLILPPTKPALLKASEVGTTHVILVWNPPSDQTALVAGYNIYRDGQQIADVGESVHLYRDEKLYGLTKYVYWVKAKNELGTQGPQSDCVTIETGEPGKPSAPQNVRVIYHSPTSIELQWHAPADNGGSLIYAYNVHRNGKLHDIQQASTGITEHYQDNINVQPGSVYVYHISALNGPVPRGTVRLCEATPAAPLALPVSVESSPGLSDLEVSAGGTGIDEMRFVERDALYRTQSATNQHHSEGLLSEGVEAKAVAMLILPRLGDGKSHIILQAFNWVSCKNKQGWYKVLLSKVDAMKEAHFSMVWLPPPAQSVSDDGYMPTKWYNLNTKYGTEEELIQLILSMRQSAIVPMLDLVVNHRCGTKQDEKGGWTIYENPDWAGWAIVTNNVQGYAASGGQDTGTQSDCAPDIDHTNSKVRADVKEWTNWIFEKIGFGAVRIDMAPGYSVGYQVEYVENLGSPFTVGEYWNGDPNSLQNYTNGGSGRIAAFDFALYYVLRRCVENNNFSDIRDGNRLQGLVGRDPGKAVTFLDNHDTEHLTFVGKFGGGNGDVVLRGYAFILTHPGTPCVYWNHFSDYGEFMRRKICALTAIRTACGITSVSGVHIDQAKWGLYAAYVSKERHCSRGGGQLAVRIGSDQWGPDGGNWQKETEGKGFCVWVKK